MRSLMRPLVLIVVSFCAGVLCYALAPKAYETFKPNTVTPGDDTREQTWDDRFSVVSISSSYDKTKQQAYAFFANKAGPRPLLVSLHSWSADYRQSDPFADLAAESDWNYIHPDFRGPNNTPESCASEAAICDIDDSIDFAIANASVDPNKIYVVGGSGGGHACCTVALVSRHRIRAAFAWVPITDIAAWYYQSKDRNAKYAADIEAILKGSDDFHDAAAMRSPIAMSLPLQTDKIHLFAGVRDGYEGSVPISHSLLFFNRLCRDLGETQSLIGVNQVAALLSRDIREPVSQLGDRDVFFHRSASFGSVTIFDGAHETLHEACFDLLMEDSNEMEAVADPEPRSSSARTSNGNRPHASDLSSSAW